MPDESYDLADLPVLGEQHVLRLDVAVAQTLRVHERERTAHLLHEARRLALGKRPHVDELLPWSAGLLLGPRLSGYRFSSGEIYALTLILHWATEVSKFHHIGKIQHHYNNHDCYM